MELSLEGMIHAGLEGGWRVCKPKRHNHKFIIFKVATKGYLGNIMFPHSDLMVSRVVLKYCNFGRYSRCIDCIPPPGDEFGHGRVIERINVNLCVSRVNNTQVLL